MKLDKEMLWNTLSRFGAGRLTSSGYPGESAGMLPPFQGWRPIGQATMAYGYGLSMTPLQLAQAYAVLAGDGLSRPVSLVRVDKPPIARRVVGPETARNVVAMLEHGGQRRRAPASRPTVTGYRVAGKTGTARKVGGRRLRRGPAHGGVRGTRAGHGAAPGHRGGGRRAARAASTTAATWRRRCSRRSPPAPCASSPCRPTPSTRWRTEPLTRLAASTP